jgi:long-chain acyl-CoA synthetase
MYIGTIAEQLPDKIASLMDDGDASITYGRLDEESNAFAHALGGLGLEPGDTLAVMLENCLPFAVAWWAAMRSGLYVTPINWHLTRDEVNYIIGNSAAKVVVTSTLTDDVGSAALADFPGVHHVRVGSGAGSALDFDELVATSPTGRLPRELAGAPMFYSSGTTGRPKGVKPALSGRPPAEHSTVSHLIMRTFGIGPADRYLSPAPLYHSAPSSWSFGAHTVGATSVIMSHFDPATALRLLDDQQITASQWVPTMFQRMLRLPDDVRARYRGDTHRVAYHAAAPCPIPVKRAMIEWWGPILVEFYAATEGGATQIDAHEWLERPGSVGRHWTGGTVHILDLGDRSELPAHRDGLIYFEPFSANRFEYHDDAEKTASVYHEGLVTAGDIGHLDGDGYLYLTDRLTNMIISGGVNIYPMEIENHLAGHPAVLDVAVFGIPNDDFGEEVKAVVQVEPERVGDEALVEELHLYCRQGLAGFKCPRSIDLVAELPRDENGKLYKRLLRETYWRDRESRLV